MTLLEEIERYLRNTGMAPSTFGSASVGEADLVRTMRAGRQPRAPRATYLRAWMKERPNGLVAVKPPPKNPVDAAQKRAVRARAKDERSAAIAEAVQAEATATGQRRQVARSFSNAKPLSVTPTASERVATLMVEEPGDLIAHVRRRWPELWAGVLASARAARIAPGAQLMTVIEAGLAAVGGEER